MIGVLLLVKDEAMLIQPLLEVLSTWTEEIVVVDTGSTDDTVEIARLYTDKVYETPLNNDFAAARNYGLERMESPWTFVVDADEMPDEHLLWWMKWYVRHPSADAVSIMRENLIDGQPIGDRTYERHIRLFRSHLRYVGKIHEQIMAPAVPSPEEYLLYHHKTNERQQRQNEFYGSFT